MGAGAGVGREAGAGREAGTGREAGAGTATGTAAPRAAGSAQWAKSEVCDCHGSSSSLSPGACSLLARASHSPQLSRLGQYGLAASKGWANLLKCIGLRWKQVPSNLRCMCVA